MSLLFIGFAVAMLAVIVSALFIAGIRLSPMFSRDARRYESLLSEEPLTSRYKPMERLLRESEWEYLATQPGFDLARINAVKAQRRKLFRGYLRCMSADFASVSYLIRVLMVQSPVARPDLARALGKFRLQYAASLLALEFRLWAHAAGIGAVNIDVSPLTRSLEQLSNQVRLLNVIQAQPDFA